MFVAFVVPFLLRVFVTCEAFIEREICLGELGCFKSHGPFYDVLWRPVSLLPGNRDSIGTTFRLYTRNNLIQPEIVNNRNDINFTASSFDPLLETKFIVHGFTESEENWMIELKDEFLNQEPMNVITVDWGQGAGIPYTQAATNTRVVGAEIALLITKLQNESGLDLNRVHLIGFSLGAHICGYAGEKLDKVRRITALDPAGPMFEDLLPVVSLDPSDAQFVDAIHTDGRTLLQLAFGSFTPVGHVDFYPNGGFKQPGCPENAVETISYATLGALLRGLDHASAEVSCRHSRARDLFLESVRNSENCLPVAYPCSDWNTFKTGLCNSCGNGCSVMGINAEHFQPSTKDGARPKLYLKTAGGRPYCLFHYSVLVKVAAEKREEGGNVLIRLPINLSAGPVAVGASYGELEISLTGDRRTSAHGTLGEEQVYEGGTEYSFLFVSERDLGKIEQLVIKWSPASTLSGLVRLKVGNSDELPIHSVTIQPMGEMNQNRTEKYVFCGDGRSATSGTGLHLSRAENTEC